MEVFLLDFFNVGGGAVGLILIGVLLPFLLTLYSIFDIVKSKFKDQNSKLLFLILVIVAPVVGSIAYLLLRRSYKLRGSDNDKMPV